MTAVVGWLSRHLHQPHQKNCDYLPCPSSSGRFEASQKDAAEFSAAYQRLEIVKDLIVKKAGALRYQQTYQQSTFSKAELAALQGQIDQYWADLKAIGAHTSELALAYSQGRSLSFDKTFWSEHKQLLQELPEPMRPDWAAEIDTESKETTASMRKRVHVEIRLVEF